MKSQFVIASFGFIFDENNRILLCHRRDYDLWNLPGGTMELGESPWECVVREVKEETGLEVEISKLAGIYNKPDKGALAFSFICKVVGGQLTLNEEADKIEYFGIEEIPANISQKQVARIRDALKEKELVLKNQTGKGAIELIQESNKK
ncbi:MAG: NUDIX domain-containing protein [Patescibacteria group bacterium]